MVMDTMDTASEAWQEVQAEEAGPDTEGKASKAKLLFSK
jgi:hypothetical protein